ARAARPDLGADVIVRRNPGVFGGLEHPPVEAVVIDADERVGSASRQVLLDAGSQAPKERNSRHRLPEAGDSERGQVFEELVRLAPYERTADRRDSQPRTLAPERADELGAVPVARR